MAKILVIDDDSDLLRFVALGLKDGYAVISTTSSEDGLVLAKTTPFDVVLTDIFMPVKDGLEVIQELIKSSPQTKIIVMTAELKGGKSDFLNFAMHLGATSKLVKPFTLENLRQVVDEVLAS